MIRASLVSLPVMSMLALVACDDGGGDAGSGQHAGHHALPPEGDAAVTCPEWTHELTYGPEGLQADVVGDAGVTARLIKASDVPARKGFNTWTVELQGTDGEPMDDYQIAWICSFMPEHNHTAGPEVTVGDEPGQFVIDRLNLGMNGGWEIPLWVDRIDEGKPLFTRMSVDNACKPVDEMSRVEDMVFRICVPRR
jgi:hypothetical protein